MTKSQEVSQFNQALQTENHNAVLQFHYEWYNILLTEV